LEEHLVTMGVTVVLKPFNLDQLVDAIRGRLGADRALRPIVAEGQPWTRRGQSFNRGPSISESGRC
jgi:hypothetical protein